MFKQKTAYEVDGRDWSSDVCSSDLVNVGMWLERFVIIVTALSKDYDPYSWGTYRPSLVEAGITVGSFGLFFTLFLVFVKVLPVLSITEVKEQAHES